MEIGGKHEERNEHGYSLREFHRKVQIPSNVRLEDVKCQLNEKGILEVTAPKMEQKEIANERILPIQQTESDTKENSDGKQAEAE